MNADGWRDLERIFTDARELPAADRRAFVARACASDDAMHQAVLRLLAGDEAPPDFMSRSAFDLLAEGIAADGWTLRPGDRLGAYVVVEWIGAGGAGEVWRATDERLGRDVAIKILLPHYRARADSLRRFSDEARTAGSINHPNMLTVHDVGEHLGVPFLVTEYLNGQSLRTRLDEGPVSVDQAVRVCLAVARGLTAAHGRGIVHRDLKPENIFLTADGGLKILDFGLATLQSTATAEGAKPPDSIAGLVAGTAGYMAPEQVQNERLDARADLFSLGVILYEMLAGLAPFRGTSTFDMLHAVLTVAPAEVAVVAPAVPRPLARIAMRLLDKSPAARFQSATDLTWALEEFVASAQDQPRPLTVVPAGPRWHIATPSRIAAAVVGLAVITVAGFSASRRSIETPPAPALTQFSVRLPAGMTLDSAPVVAPNGREIAFVGKDATGSRLFVRSLGAREAVAVPGTDDASQPFWSPASDGLGFFARGRLLKVAWPGGATVVMAAAPEAYGGSWSRSGTIAFAPAVILTGLSRVSADGGSVAAATMFDAALGDTSHWWPVFLPDGIHFLYHVRSVNDSRIGVYVGRTDQPPAHAVVPVLMSDTDVAFAPMRGSGDGALVSVADGRIQVRRFDMSRMAVTGNAREIGFVAGASTLYRPVMVSASRDVLAFAEGVVPSGSRLEVVDRDGRRLRTWNLPEAQNWPRVSPDGRLLARQRIDALRNNPDIWVEDLERGTQVRITTDGEPDIQPAWSPDGGRLAYVSGNVPDGSPGARRLNIASADGTGLRQTMPCPSVYCEPTDWAPNGRGLLVNVLGPGGWKVWTVPIDQANAPSQPLFVGPSSERDARYSPDGGWVVYVSQESGRSEVSVRDLSGASSRFVLSSNGGAQPVWRRDGGEIFFVEPGGRLQSVAVRTRPDGGLSFGLPVTLDVPPIGFGHWGTQYDVSPDGSRIYFMRRNDDPGPVEFQVVIGWSELLGDFR